MKTEGELQKSQEDEADGKKEKEKTTQGLIEEILTDSTPPASKSPAPNMDLGAQDQKKNPKSEGLQWDLRT